MVFKPPEGASAEVLRDILNAIIGSINSTLEFLGLPPVTTGQFTVDPVGVGLLPFSSSSKISGSGLRAVVQAVAVIIVSLTFLKFEIDVIEPAAKGEIFPLALLAGGGILLFLWLTRRRR